MADETHFEPGVAGSTDHPQHRAGEGEGFRKEPDDDSKPPQISIFDGKGNESVVVATTDAEGKVAQGTGPSAAAAEEDAKTADGGLGDAFSPGKH
jgi:hypothetical protein